jgi:lysophospholipase L1-like esterase
MQAIEEMKLNNLKYILAFGDSLTKGYYCNGIKYHPYSIKMNKLFEEKNMNFKVIDLGVNGETTSRMLDRIKKTESPYLLTGYALVIIYGEANDLETISAKKIANNLIQIHNFINKQNVKSVHVTLPENECDKFFSFYAKKRKKTNEIIKKEITDNKNIILCDLDQEIKFSKMTKQEKKKYWDDYIHLTPEGYELMGEIIFKSILAHISKLE